MRRLPSLEDGPEVKTKPIDYQKHADHFIDLDGKRYDAPEHDNFAIVAPPWDEVTRQPGVMQAKCSICDELVGTAPATQKVLAEGDHPIFCRPCFELLRKLDAMGILPGEYKP
jgi:hypothetical protein